ncbi:MAG: hypothetical protein NT167_02465, partial [Verrucomicrobia bacterium]|nr:hypothetical protein [Verrucomicrobiota bacterium]
QASYFQAVAAPAQAQAVGVVAGAIVVVVSLIISISFLWLLGKKSNLLIPKAYAVPPRSPET